MALARFPLIIRRWRRSQLYHGDYAQYTQLREYLPEDVFLARLDTINSHVYKEYPHIWLDTYLFVIAVIFVLVTACFSVVARAAGLSMWYPLILLSVPVIIAFFTTKRRNAYYKRLSNYYDSLQSCLKELNSLDVTRQVKWSFRRLRETDTAVSMHLKPPLSKYSINFIIDVVQINTENELAEEGELLPAYHTSMMDVVLDIGPEVEQAPGNRSEYLVPQSTANTLMHSHRSPPAYERALEEPSHPPPAYLTEHSLPSSRTENI